VYNIFVDIVHHLMPKLFTNMKYQFETVIILETEAASIKLRLPRLLVCWPSK
jgi:hypothetical protein